MTRRFIFLYTGLILMLMITIFVSITIIIILFMLNSYHLMKIRRLRTTLCLQYKPHYIAAGSIFLAAKSQKVKLPSASGKKWWMQFDVSPKQLEGLLL